MLGSTEGQKERAFPRIRVRPRFFDQGGHQTANASFGNKHFFTK